MFKHPNHDYLHFDQMHEHCPHCGLKYEVEQGFFWGAMYFSYAFAVAVVVIVGGALYLSTGSNTVWHYLAAIFGVMIPLMPLFFRYSRALMLHLFGGVSYDPAQDSAASQRH